MAQPDAERSRSRGRWKGDDLCCRTITAGVRGTHLVRRHAAWSVRPASGHGDRRT
jgi:hypothetical protein